jgi:hypothetical protein
MKIKRFAMLAVFGLASFIARNAEAGLEAITNDSRAIRTHTEGKIDIPYCLGIDYIKEGVPLIGKLSRVLGNSPYRMTQLSGNDFIFFEVNKSAITSRFVVVESKDTSDKTRHSFKSGVYLSGSRDFVRRFEGYMLINFKSNSTGQIDYMSDMFIVPENRVRAFFIRNGMCLPIFGDYIREPFEKEQRDVILMLNNVATNILRFPEQALEKIKGYSNAVEGILFTPREVNFVEESLIRSGCLKKDSCKK